MPRLWLPVGPSGEMFVEHLLGTSEVFHQRISLLPVSYNREADKVEFSQGDPASDMTGQRVLLIDSSVHSGKTMFRIAQEIAALSKPEAICSYSLIVKQSSMFIPSFWGVTINDHDRAYFLLDKLPNNRLNPKDPFIQIRRLTHQDLKKPPVNSGLPSLDRITWADRFYTMHNSNRRDHVTFLLESGADILGYVSVTLDSMIMSLDEVAIDVTCQKKGYATALMRWVETCARQSKVEEIQLWGIEAQVPLYENFKYKRVADHRMDLDDGTYHLMSKRVLYHL